jgi:hypothetical protein
MNYHSKPLGLLALLVVFVASSACKKKTESSLQHLTANKNSNNRAILFSGDKSGGIGQGVEMDIELLNKGLPTFGFRMESHQADTEEQLLQHSARVAGEMLDDPDATLFWFISTHGSPQGHLSMGNERSMSTFNNVAASMRKARGDKAFRRLIVFIEACFSGQNVNGNKTITNQTGRSSDSLSGMFDYGLSALGLTQQGPSDAEQLAANILGQMIGLRPQNTFADSSVNGSPNSSTNRSGNTFPNTSPSQTPQQNSGPLMDGLYEQLIVIGSSSADEYSYVRTDGSIAVLAFMDALDILANQKDTATIGDFVDTMKRVSGSTNQQTLQFKLEPENLSSELLFN